MWCAGANTKTAGLAKNDYAFFRISGASGYGAVTITVKQTAGAPCNDVASLIFTSSLLCSACCSTTQYLAAYVVASPSTSSQVHGQRNRFLRSQRVGHRGCLRQVRVASANYNTASLTFSAPSLTYTVSTWVDTSVYVIGALMLEELHCDLRANVLCMGRRAPPRRFGASPTEQRNLQCLCWCALRCSSSA